jgi:hypothetical protein
VRFASLLPTICSGGTRPIRRASDASHGPTCAHRLGDLDRATPWLWLHCEKCQHYAPLACAVPVVRWGADASSDVLRERALHRLRGAKGATIQHPGWAGEHIGFLPFQRTWIPRGFEPQEQGIIHCFQWYMAEREGFEPPIRLPVCRISSAVLSTTQPPLRRIEDGSRVARVFSA